MNLSAYLEERKLLIDAALHAALPDASERPATLHAAMRHSLFAGGKRLRPVLLLAAAEACGGTPEPALPLACAVECLHTYTLIHDDLPCMDDDDFRRGRPTCHKVFGEGIAVLAGDALQALAFGLLATAAAPAPYTTGDYVRIMAAAAGSRHLVGGQVLDLEGEGRDITLEELRFIHESKTAALLTVCLQLGGLSAGAGEGVLDRLRQFGQCVGLAFQIIDDILDVTQTAETMGKSAGKDAAVRKATYPALLGLEASREEAARLTREARASLSGFGEKGVILQALADEMLGRSY